MNYKILTILIIALNHCFSQSKGEIIYKVTEDIGLLYESKNNHTEEALINQELKNASTKLYILKFMHETSSYKEYETLDLKPKNIEITRIGGVSYLYKKNNSYINQVNYLGKYFIIKDTLIGLNWKILNDTKVIKGYTCRKAIATNEYIGIDNKLYIEEIVAFFTDEIKSNQGPDFLFGLPGVILEAKKGILFITCQSIKLKNIKNISPPKRGIIVSKQRYNELIKKHVINN